MRRPTSDVGVRFRVEVHEDECIRFVDLDLDGRTFTLSLDAAIELGERLGGVLLLARNYSAAEAQRAGLSAT